MASSRSATPPVNDADVFSVSEFSEVVDKSLRAMFHEGIWIEGEVEGLRPTNKHAYFSLIEHTDDDKKAVLNVNVWASSFASITGKLRKHGVELKNGLKVRFFGKPQYYAPQGKLSFIVSDVDTQFSVGDIAKKREELIQKLRDTGLVRRNKSLSVPIVPLRLGIVSSAQAAGWADARKHLVESGFGFSVLFCDVRVQGDEAIDTISAGIRSLGARDDIDVILVMRGGGSKSDLAAFDDEKVAMAIVRCPKPVFTGIGHEIDISVADIVAHTSCKTPTACADEVIGYVQEFVEDISGVAHKVRSRTQSAISLSRQKMSLNIEKLRTRSRRALENQNKDLEKILTKVQALDPVHTMSRGWSITRDGKGNVVRSISDVTDGDSLVTTVVDGQIISTVGKR